MLIAGRASSKRPAQMASRMAIPPSRGVGREWIFKGPGESRSPNFAQSHMTAGTTAKTSAKLIAAAIEGDPLIQTAVTQSLVIRSPCEPSGGRDACESVPPCAQDLVRRIGETRSARHADETQADGAKLFVSCLRQAGRVYPGRVGALLPSGQAARF